MTGQQRHRDSKDGGPEKMRLVHDEMGKESQWVSKKVAANQLRRAISTTSCSAYEVATAACQPVLSNVAREHPVRAIHQAVS